MRVAFRAFFAAVGVALVALVAAPSAGAQTTTTIPPIPVTGGPSTTTTTAPGGGEGTEAGVGMAETGLATDQLVPFGFVMIGAGAALDALARRRPKQRLVLG